jgi:hypothetical protein
MLRSLAFRLREGAEGVVLVKPQFELPSHLVKDGKVEAPELRQRALDTFRAKAERLGFVLCGWFDSPVTGGSGTVEMLAYLRFTGRPESMPRPGERKPVRGGGKKSATTGGALHWFAVASPGLENRCVTSWRHFLMCTRRVLSMAVWSFPVASTPAWLPICTVVSPRASSFAWVK